MTGKLSGDTVGSTVGVFTNATPATPVTLSATSNAGSYKESVISLGGANASDYSLASSGNTLGTISVGQKTLTASLTGTPSKVYDGSTSISLAGVAYSLVGLVGAESFSLTGTPVSGTLSLKDVGSRTVTADLSSGITYTGSNGALMANYVLPASASGSGTVTARPITLTASDGSKT